MPVITDDLMHRGYTPRQPRGFPACARGTNRTLQRTPGDNSTFCTTLFWHFLAEPSTPHEPSRTPKSTRIHWVSGPTSTHLPVYDHEASSSIVAVEFWIRQFFPSPRCCEGRSVHCVRFSASRAITLKDRNQSGVQSQLTATEGRETFRHLLREPGRDPAAQANPCV